MTLKTFLATWDGTRRENLFWRGTNMVLLAAVLVLSISVYSVDRTVVLVPPENSKTVAISRDAANVAFKQSWALYLVELVGNINPGNDDLVKDAIGPLLDSSIYREVVDVMEDQLNALKLDGISLSYEPREVFYEPQTRKVFVTGVQTAAGPSGQPDRKTWSYELVIDIRRYRPVITHVTAYAGDPRTLDRLPREEQG